MQDIITYTIVVLSFAYTGYQLVRFFIPSKNADMSCGGGCGSCEIKNDILQQYQLKNLTLDKKRAK